jgi:hypothetical protein
MKPPDWLRGALSPPREAAWDPDRLTTGGVLGSDRIVTFADMLGFAALTEGNAIDPRELQKRTRPLGTTFDEIFDSMGTPRNPLTDAFSSFHFNLRHAITTAAMRHPLTAITFSDSVFIATTYLFQAVNFSMDLALSMLSSKVPVRIGIAFGSFAAIGFRSDVSADGGDHAAQFLGTAVVRASQAEKCGIKGIRILLHPSVEPLLADRIHNPSAPPSGARPVRPLDCSETELQNPANKASVRYEVDYWDLASTKERAAWRGLQEMWTAAPDWEENHYRATAEAIDRMRVAQGEAPLTNLRRRNLKPRRRPPQSQEF